MRYTRSVFTLPFWSFLVERPPHSEIRASQRTGLKHSVNFRQVAPQSSKWHRSFSGPVIVSQVTLDLTPIILEPTLFSVPPKRTRERVPCGHLRSYLNKWTAAQVEAELDHVHRCSVPELKTVDIWINEFKRDPTCTEDEMRSGCSVELITNDVTETRYSWYRNLKTP